MWAAMPALRVLCLNTEIVPQPPEATANRTAEVPAAIEVLPPDAVNQADNSVTTSRSTPVGLWTSYSSGQLHNIVRNSIDTLKSLTRAGQKEIRDLLVPALQEIKRRFSKGEKVAGFDGIEAYLEGMGIKPNTVRQWEFRLRESELKQLIGNVDADTLANFTNTTPELAEPTLEPDYEVSAEIGPEIGEPVESLEDEWQAAEMPEFVNPKVEDAYATIVFRCRTKKDLDELGELTKQKLTQKTKSAWYRPEASPRFKKSVQ